MSFIKTKTKPQNIFNRYQNQNLLISIGTKIINFKILKDDAFKKKIFRHNKCACFIGPNIFELIYFVSTSTIMLRMSTKGGRVLFQIPV